MKKDLLKYIGYTLVTALWGTVAFIVPDFFDNPVEGWKGVLTVSGYVLALGGAQLLLLWLTGLNKWVNAFFLPVYAALGSVLVYFRLSNHMTLTPMILDSTFHTNAGEAAGVITWPLIAYLLINLTIAALLIRWRWKKIPTPPKAWLCLIIGLLVWGAYYFGHDRLHRSINQRYPYNVVYNLAEYIHIEKQRKQPRVMDYFNDTQLSCYDDDTQRALRASCYDSNGDGSDGDSVTVVLMLGEAIRYDHLSINGYGRETTPRIEKRHNLFTLGDVYSDYTHTLASLPHILTPADSLHPEWAYSKEGLVAYYKQAGWHTAWISNQDMGETYVHFIQTADTAIFPNSGKSVFVFHGWYDDQLLPYIMEESERSPRSLCVVHTIGAHWYYGNHVPEGFAPFAPVTHNRSVTDNKPEEVINSYDNCVAFLDVVIDSLCGMLQDRTAVVIYQSDHGEALGEEGRWLHGAGQDETKHPAGLVWYSDKYRERYPEKAAALDSLRGKRLRTDYVFPTMMRLMK